MALFLHRGRQYVAQRDGRRLRIFVPLQSRPLAWHWLSWLAWLLTFGIFGRRSSIHRAARKALRAPPQKA